jgi:hypothetical protein
VFFCVYILMDGFAGWASIWPTKIGLCLGPALWAEMAAQALTPHRVGPALGTLIIPRVVLFRVVPRVAHCTRPIWNSICITYNICLDGIAKVTFVGKPK